MEEMVAVALYRQVGMWFQWARLVLMPIIWVLVLLL
jgi:hypothetical protein